MQTKTTRKPKSKMPLKKTSANTIKIRKKAMIAALTKSLGIVSAACQQVGVSRWTHYDWMQKDAKYKTEVENISENAVDFAEGKLLAKINSGDTIATIFYLKTKGKARGYVEKQEIDNNVKIDQPIIIDWTGTVDVVKK